jgi:osmoprotectant transport system permease protein
MNNKNRSLYYVAFLGILLGLILIFGDEFEAVLVEIAGREGTTYIRTPVYVYFWQHIQMTAASGLIAVGLGLILGIFATTRLGAGMKESLMRLVKLGQAFPSPALLALAVPVFGYGIKGALLALVVYAMMPIVFNVVVGIEEVPKDIVEAGVGMGMNEFQLYKNLKIPMALEVIIGGIRTALVINISAATLAAAVGAGGLGVLIVNGVRTFDMALIMQGAIPVSLLAIMTELLLKWMQEHLSWKSNFNLSNQRGSYYNSAGN